MTIPKHFFPQRRKPVPGVCIAWITVGGTPICVMAITSCGDAGWATPEVLM
jgi:hypothetical protein